jgi:hypothetical protein
MGHMGNLGDYLPLLTDEVVVRLEVLSQSIDHQNDQVTSEIEEQSRSKIGDLHDFSRLQYTTKGACPDTFSFQPGGYVHMKMH